MQTPHIDFAVDLKKIEPSGSLHPDSIDALEAFAPLAKGSPICRTHASEPRFDGIEMVLKGGQVGGPDFFVAAKRGG